MTKENKKELKSFAPKLEILVILVFFLCFIIWTVSKCSKKRSAIQQEQMLLEENEARAAEAAAIPEEVTETVATKLKPKPVETPKPPKTKNLPTETKSILYITIDGLNMRTDPHLDSTVVVKLPLFEEVYFMDEVTDFKQEISLGKKVVNEPWVKVKTKKGREGWVYGAGVNYYKVKTEGVQ